MKKIFIFLLICIVFLPCFVYGLDNEDINLTKNATSAILMEEVTGAVLYNKDANKISSVASLTKMMSLIIIFEFMEKGGMTYYC